MKIINMTPEAVSVYYGNTLAEGPNFTYSPSGRVAKIATNELGANRVNGAAGRHIHYEMVEYGRLEGLSLPEPGTMYIVSLTAALAVRGRGDLLCPYDPVLTPSGVQVGYRTLQKVC